MKYEAKQRHREERTNARSSCAKQEAEKRSAASVTTFLRNLSSLAAKHFLWMVHILLPTCIPLDTFYLCVSLPGYLPSENIIQGLLEKPRTYSTSSLISFAFSFSSNLGIFFLPFVTIPINVASVSFCTSGKRRSWAPVFLPAFVFALPSAAWQPIHLAL